ncbi:MAG: histidinol-phosphatase [Balneola sp.]|jgi:myo-inositol-1(or 4)-monophosphatase|nr:histidinol-phosphatase [Balneola sp.]MBE80144.1 histidinol-phosphatase [Balneola sp.]MBE80914.1 histidinol-phosphatase [Balneola sp.]HBX64634.1 histidinol-phosphatase [Balneolaceae bacterium]|tara:strand:+ start:818 stop:1588 length:771 start_codon:yes stop_codon:yes gene_type:complete
MNQELLQAATEIAKIGGHHTLKYFKKNVEVISKADDSPVTIADKETEQIIRKEIQKRYPDHGIIGEEFGRTNEDSNIQWVLDPIDGTKSFIHGIPFYTTLIGILIDNEPQVGIIYAPALEEICVAAIGEGATLNGEPCKVRDTEQLEDATLLVTEIYRFKEMDQQEVFEELMSKTKLHRTWGDAYGHMMVATGRADVMYDPILNIWDAAALLPVMREAGGVFSDIEGNETIHSGNGFSTNKALFPEVKKIFEAHSK